ncbi:hypothetical protein P9112_003546 [Eukaryota sp. TZLM1-RC]
MERWVQEQNTEKGLKAATVIQFPEHFRSSSNANIQKASDWWKKRHQFYRRLEKDKLSLERVQNSTVKKILLKARSGRGRKRAEWVEWVHKELLEEFLVMKKIGCKIDTSILGDIAKHVLRTGNHPIFRPEWIDPQDKSGKMLMDRIQFKWIQQFMARFNIVPRTQTGKLSVGAVKQEEIERAVAFHLGNVARMFQDRGIDHSQICNFDETHFRINMDNNKTLGFIDDEEVRYTDVVSGSQGMTLVVKLTGGPNARIDVPFLIFQNQSESYPIRNLQDSDPQVAYRTAKKDFMTSQKFAEYLEERRVNCRMVNKKQIFFCDNVPSHKLTARVKNALTRLHATVCFLPPNSTHLVQPCDTFIIAMIKRAWTKPWDRKKVEMIQNNEYSASGKLLNPGKRYFLNLAKEVVAEINSKRNENGILTPE